MFRLATPVYLYLLSLIPFMAGLFWFYILRRRRSIEMFGDSQTLNHLMPDVSPKRIRNKFILVVVAMTLLILSLARPQFGSKLREVNRKGIEIMMAVDVSNSMLAEDFQPNRLERAKYAITRLIEKLDQDCIGLIIFAGDAYVQLPITSDYVAAQNFINSISPDMISRQGTAIGAAIDLATKSFSSSSEGSRVVIIISDGENHEDDAIAAAKRAADQGIKIYTIGLGTPEGAPISINSEFLQDEEGNMVVSKLDEKSLKEIALLTNGAYIRANNKDIGLNEIIRKINEVEKKDLTTMIFEDFNEQYQYLVGIALALLLVELLMLGRKNRILQRFSIFK